MCEFGDFVFRMPVATHDSDFIIFQPRVVFLIISKVFGVDFTVDFAIIRIELRCYFYC